MRKAVLILAMLSGLGAADAAQAQASKPGSSTGKQTYKWVDEKGVTHYGDHVPSEYSQREQRVLNEQGLEVQKRQAELSPAEALERAKKQKDEAQRKQHDMFLISTYPSTREIESVRDTRLDQINGQISAAEAYIASLNTRVEGLKARSKNFAPYNTNPGARRLPDDLAEEMVRALSELRTQNSALASRRTEAKAVTEQFNGDIQRFKELRASAASRLSDASQPKKQ